METPASSLKVGDFVHEVHEPNMKPEFADSQQFTLHPRPKALFQMPPSMAHAARPRISRDQQQILILWETTNANLRRLPTSDNQAAPVR